ncbi:lachesin-like [Melanaphis sacchari]|uniref:lachesin-like n=1 Tax=Melanaphis sacchari TaxID=742174 RepID=UPI000DC15112|nr:lachesin-like [Melanaphis sacchari]
MLAQEVGKIPDMSVRIVVKLCVSIHVSKTTTVKTHSQNIQTTVKDVGGAVEMKCSVFNASGVPVAWIKFDKKEPTKTSVLSIGKKLIVRNPRFSVEIQNIRDTDVVFYRCVVMCDVDDGINTSADIKLEVNRSPSILKLSSSPATLIAREGRPSKLECYADRYPEPKR